MGLIRALITTRDKAYGTALARGLAATGKIDVTRDPRLADVRILDGAAGSGTEETDLRLPVVLLTEEERNGQAVYEEDPGDGEPEPAALLCAYRYLPAPKLAAVLLAACGKGDLGEGRRTGILAVAAEDGGCGCTAIAVDLARILTRQRRKTLYVNLCPLTLPPDQLLSGEAAERTVAPGRAFLRRAASRREESAEGTWEENDELGWTRLCYRLRRGRDPWLAGMTEESGDLFYLRTPYYNKRAGEVDAQLLLRLSAAAAAAGFVELVLDLGNHLEGNRLSLLAVCDRVVTVNAGHTLEQLTKELRQVVRVINFHREEVEEVGDSAEDAVQIPYLGRLSADSIDGEFGVRIGRIAALCGSRRER